MEVIYKSIEEVKELLKSPRHLLCQVLNLLCVIFSALMFWKFLMILTGSQSPVVVVLSGSMEPGFYRGDILLLNNPQQLYVGDVVVFKLEDRTIPIVHRAIDLHITKEEEIFLLTKGDNNRVDDRSLYGRNKFWLNRHHILGTAVGRIPFIGMLTILLNEYAVTKVIIISIMCFLVLTGKD